ncbi:hypothetical protein [uncultured Roseibium sp.]|uniref:hypothetical protein n=1 Tax=uncultured Roseibium sp. TaxID=1936171 RepID=UPI00260571AE|nr:hypothetical protein [uncultured Roseibium sp.]
MNTENSADDGAGATTLAKSARSASVNSSLTAFLQRNVRVLMALNAISVAVTVLLFVGLFFTWSATAELNQIRQHLSGLQEFEKRISGSVSLMNTGVQNRLSKIDQRLSQIQSGVRLMRIERGDSDIPIDKLKTKIDRDIDFFHSTTAAAMFSPALSAQAVNRFESARTIPRVTFARQPEEAQGSALFRRVVTSDGKVRYEKRQGSSN